MKLHALRSQFTRVTILLVLGLICVGGIVRAADIGAIQNISNDPTNSLQPRVAQDPDGNIHTVWVDDNGAGRSVRYSKGTWNGSAYTFGASTLLADVGGFQYALPNLAVSRNGTIMVAWSNNFTLQARLWSASAGQPGGAVMTIGSGIQPSIATDSANRFHIAWSGDSLAQYCQWEGTACTKRDTLTQEAANRPDIAVDSNDGVHVVWDGGGIRYRSRASGAEWSAIQTLGPGIKAQIGADSQGTVHIVYSNDYNIAYCRKTLAGGCTEQHVIDSGNDLDPSIGVTPLGSVIVGFRDATAGRERYDTRENGTWAGPRDLDGGITVDVAQQLYTERTSLVWSRDYEIQHVALSVAVAPVFTGSLQINGGAERTNQAQVSVAVTNASATDVPSAYGLADGAAPTALNQPFTNPTTTTTFALDVADGACRVHTVYGKLANANGQSAAFSDDIIYDPAVNAMAQARNPNLPSNPMLNDFHTLAVPAGDITYTRRTNFNLGVWGAPDECSGLAQYALAAHGVAPDPAAWHDVPAEGYISRQVNFTPNYGVDNGQGTFQYDVYATDKAGNTLPTPIVISVVYDNTAPTVSTAGPLPTTASPKGGIASISMAGVTVNDNLYPDQGAGRKYWGYWIAVKQTGAGAPTDNDWNQYGLVRAGAMRDTLTWHVGRGLIGGTGSFTPGPYTVYVRFLDGAGNASGAVASQPLQVNQLELFSYLPQATH